MYLPISIHKEEEKDKRSHQIYNMHMQTKNRCPKQHEYTKHVDTVSSIEQKRNLYKLRTIRTVYSTDEAVSCESRIALLIEEAPSRPFAYFR